jgi:hypothetical protein
MAFYEMNEKGASLLPPVSLTSRMRLYYDDVTALLMISTNGAAYLPLNGDTGYSIFEDEGTPVTARSTANFTGAGVTVSDVGGKTTVNIPGAAGAAATTIEKDLGAANWRGKFTITDASISASSKVLCWQAPGPYTGKGTRADEAEVQPVQVIEVEPAAGSASVKWQTPPILAMAPSTNDAPGDSQVVAGTLSTNETYAIQRRMKRIGRIKGNVKFTYMVI